MDLEKLEIAIALKGMSIFCGILILPFPVGVYYITRVVVCGGANLEKSNKLARRIFFK